MNRKFWEDKKVLITGHTGFKGTWLSLWLNELGAKVYGYALAPNTTPAIFDVLRMSSKIDHCIGDVRDLNTLKSRLKEVNPDIVIHMAAQPLVRYSYDNPVETYETNVMGTVNLLESVRSTESVKVVINVTTDKCYENKEWEWGYRENEPMGGYDPYSNSKGCSELVTSAYRSSYFNPINIKSHNKSISSARAGNVIGGGDWSIDRLIPDVIKAFSTGKDVSIRNPLSIRPWQHVLEPLSGYLTLAEKMWLNPEEFSSAWNFGPLDNDVKNVGYIVEYLKERWSSAVSWKKDNVKHPHEANYLKLDISKAGKYLDWYPTWTINETLNMIVEWYSAYIDGLDMLPISLMQIKKYETDFSERNNG